MAERQPVDHLSDRELLMLLNDRSERIEAAVLGNGQPGLVTRVAQLDGEREATDEEHAAVKQAAQEAWEPEQESDPEPEPVKPSPTIEDILAVLPKESLDALAERMA